MSRHYLFPHRSANDAPTLSAKRLVFTKTARAVLFDQLCQPVVDLSHISCVATAANSLRGTSNCDINLTLMADLDDYWFGPAASPQEMSDQFDGLLRRGQTDPAPAACLLVPPRAPAKAPDACPLVIRDGVYFIHVTVSMVLRFRGFLPVSRM